MIQANPVAALGAINTAQLPATLDAAARGANLIEAFAKRLETTGTPVETELSKLIAAAPKDADGVIDLPDTDPRMRRIDQLSAMDRVHFPEQEGTFGMFPIELTDADLAELVAGRDAIVAAISTVNNEPLANLQRRLIGLRAVPAFGVDGETLTSAAAAIERLLDVYSLEVLGRKRAAGPSLLVIAGGILLGAVVFGGIVYTTRKRA